MCKTKKIIVAFLCAFVAGIGVLAINPQTSSAVTLQANTQTTTTAISSMSLEQLQQIIEMLKQQIQQIIVSLQQRAQTCVGEGEIFTDGNRQCCAGLTRQTTSSTDCIISGSGDCGVSIVTYSCVKSSTCAETCKTKGYTNSTCAAWGITQHSSAGGCASGQTSVGWTSDCTAAQLAGGGRACCCYNQTTTCAKEGENIYTSSLANGRPTQCCSGLTAISSCTADGICPNDGSSICAYCGNGVCGLGENKVNCPKDCGGTEDICSRTLSGSPTEAEKAECAQASGTIYCGNGWCSCSCAQKTCAETCRAKGYTNSTCAAWGITQHSSAGGCASGQTSVGWTSDCTAAQLAGGGRACCCYNQTTTCAKEGENIYTSSLANGRPTQCCSGLTAISSCTADGICPNDGSSICAYCGNGVCGLGENSYTCPADCAVQEAKECSARLSAGDCKLAGGNYVCSYLTVVSVSGTNNTGASSVLAPRLNCYCSCPICNKKLSGSPTTAEKDDCEKAEGTIYCGNGWCECAKCGALSIVKPEKKECSAQLSASDCKLAGGAYVCTYAVVFSNTNTSDNAASSTFTSQPQLKCYCSCPN